MGWIYWDPDPVFVRLPIIDYPIAWYGFLFAIGFALGYLILVKILKNYLLPENLAHFPNPREASSWIVDTLAWLIVLGTIIGARLGHVFFYDWPYYKDHPLAIIKIWEGGLASHGGAIGVLLGLLLAFQKIKRRVPEVTFSNILDAVAIPTALVGCCIRLGNFFNQEILGLPTDLPWAVVFGHPIDGSAPVPRHPVQLYEALFYLLVFMMLMIFAKRGLLGRERFISGLFFVLVFGFRFVVEFFKVSQSAFITEGFPLLMGQLLSLPFVILGLILLFSSRCYDIHSSS
ncbi:MAG: prolipoprotein diacylglyceryl transferase [Chlamydiota bacterium]